MEESLENLLVDALTREARRRLGPKASLEVIPARSSLEIRVRLAAHHATGKLRRTFWEDFVRSGGQDDCACVDHFFAHLRRQLDLVDD